MKGNSFFDKHLFLKKGAGSALAIILILSLVMAPVYQVTAAPGDITESGSASDQTGGEPETVPGDAGQPADPDPENNVSDSGDKPEEPETGTDKSTGASQAQTAENAPVSAESSSKNTESAAAETADTPDAAEAEEEDSADNLKEDEPENIVDGEIIVIYDDAGVSQKKAEKIQGEAEEALEELDIEVTEEISEAGDEQGTVVAAEIPEEMNVSEAVDAVMADENVSYAQPNYKYELADNDVTEQSDINTESVVTNDLYVKSGYAYYLNNTRVSDAWETAQSNNGVTVAVFDTGCRLDHEDLAGNVLKNLAYDAYYKRALTASNTPSGGDPVGHGTHVSGLIAARAGNGLGIAGTSYNANILPIKICDNNGNGATTQSILNGIYYCQRLVGEGTLKNLRVINISLGYYATSNSYQVDYLLETLLEDMAYGFNVLSVCAGGNGDSVGTPYTISMYPSDFDVCLSVTALNRNGTNCSWSDYNMAKDISAPGESIYSTYNRNAKSYVTMSGTSMAAPIVSGICALLWSKNLSWSVEQIKTAVEVTADPISDNQTGVRKGRTGSHGAINAMAALWYLSGLPYRPTSLSAVNVSLQGTSYTYNGKARTPGVTVQGNGIVLSQGRDYTVSYSNNVKVGTATVTVTGLGRPYTGVIKKTFKIIPKGTSISKLTKKSKGFTVKWKKQATQTTGYQIQYSTSKTFKSAKTKTIKKTKTTSATISKLKKKKTYYVRVRTYKTVGGKKYYSGWSKVKKVKTK